MNVISVPYLLFIIDVPVIPVIGHMGTGKGNFSQGLCRIGDYTLG